MEKANMIRIIVMLSAFLLLALSASSAEFTKNDINMELVKSVGTVRYTPTCLVECHLPLKVTIADPEKSGNPKNFSVSGIFAKQLYELSEKNTLRDDSITLMILENVSYIERHHTYANVTNFFGYSKDNETESWIKSVPEGCKTFNSSHYTCDDIVRNGVVSVEKTRLEWRPLTDQIRSHGKTFYIDYFAKRRATLGKTSVDFVPVVHGFEFPEFAWWNSSSTYRINVTFNSTEIGGDLTNFTAFVNLTAFPDTFFGNVTREDGLDIIVVDTDGISLLPREIIGFSKVTNRGQLFFKVNLSSSTDQPVSIYYNNTGIIQYNENITYDPRWVGVFHMEEDPAGTAPQMNDSTMEDNDGTSGGSMTAADVVTGVLGSGIDFDGSNDHIEINEVLTENIIDTTRGTWIAWAKPDDATPAALNIIASFGDVSENGDLDMEVRTDGKFEALFVDQALHWQLRTDSAVFSDGVWTQVAVVHNGTHPLLYVDGEVVAQTYIGQNNPEKWFSNSSNLDNGRIGDLNFNQGGEQRFFNGVIDEVRIKNENSSRFEINASYRNMRHPELFYSIGDVETESAGGAGNANETAGDDAIELAIDSSVPSAIKYKTQQLYVVNSSNSQWQGTVDYLVVQNSPQRRWLFNYITAGESYLNAQNLSNTVYVLEIEDKTSDEITQEVSTLINGTK